MAADREAPCAVSRSGDEFGPGATTPYPLALRWSEWLDARDPRDELAQIQAAAETVPRFLLALALSELLALAAEESSPDGAARACLARLGDPTERDVQVVRLPLTIQACLDRCRFITRRCAGAPAASLLPRIALFLSACDGALGELRVARNVEAHRTSSPLEVAQTAARLRGPCARVFEGLRFLDAYELYWLRQRTERTDAGFRVSARPLFGPRPFRAGVDLTLAGDVPSGGRVALLEPDRGRLIDLSPFCAVAELRVTPAASSSPFGGRDGDVLSPAGGGDETAPDEAPATILDFLLFEGAARTKRGAELRYSTLTWPLGAWRWRTEHLADLLARGPDAGTPRTWVVHARSDAGAAVRREDAQEAPPDHLEPLGARGELAVFRSTIDGKTLLRVPEGAVRFGCPGAEVTCRLPAFYVDRGPVTRREFQRFAAATGRAAFPAWWGDTFDDRPADGLKPGEIRAYADWARRRLPTEWEWLRLRSLAPSEGPRGGDGAAAPPAGSDDGPWELMTAALKAFPWQDGHCGQVEPGTPMVWVLRGGATDNPFCRYRRSFSERNDRRERGVVFRLALDGAPTGPEESA